MQPNTARRVGAAIVPISLFAIAYILLAPPTFVGHLRTALRATPGVVVIDPDIAVDSSFLRGMVWLPRKALNRRLMQKVDTILWVRAATAQPADLLGRSPTSCTVAHGITLCIVAAAGPQPWRLSEHLRGTAAAGPDQNCISESADKKCRYGKNNWEYLRRETHRFDGDERRCIWSHPLATAALTITTTPLSAGRYRLGAGIDDQGVRGELPPVVVKARVHKGAALGSLSLPDQRGWRSLELALLRGGTRLELTIEAPVNGARFLCWDLQKMP